MARKCAQVTKNVASTKPARTRACPTLRILRHGHATIYAHWPTYIAPHVQLKVSKELHLQLNIDFKKSYCISTSLYFRFVFCFSESTPDVELKPNHLQIEKMTVKVGKDGTGIQPQKVYF